jgi:hypothetical protein
MGKTTKGQDSFENIVDSISLHPTESRKPLKPLSKKQNEQRSAIAEKIQRLNKSQQKEAMRIIGELIKKNIEKEEALLRKNEKKADRKLGHELLVPLIGKKKNSQLADKLISILKDYKSNKDVLNNWPKLSNTIVELRNVYESTRDFIRNLEDLSSVAKSIMTRQLSCCDYENIEEATSRAENIFDATKIALSKLTKDEDGNPLPKDKGGRPRDVALAMLINKLAKIYKEATGKEPKRPDYYVIQYQGPFLDFVEACREGIGESGGKCSTGSAIRRVLK